MSLLVKTENRAWDACADLCDPSRVTKPVDQVDAATRLDVFGGQNYSPSQTWSKRLARAAVCPSQERRQQFVRAALKNVPSKEGIGQRAFLRKLLAVLEADLPANDQAKLREMSLLHNYPASCALVALAVELKEAAKPSGWNLLTIQGGQVIPRSGQ